LNFLVPLFNFSDPKAQLQLAIQAVFDSWDSPRAVKYRSINRITGLKGTAVNVQCMVFGNMGNSSGTGVLFTRNPSTGEKKLYGEFLINAQVKVFGYDGFGTLYHLTFLKESPYYLLVLQHTVKQGCIQLPTTPKWPKSHLLVWTRT